MHEMAARRDVLNLAVGVSLLLAPTVVASTIPPAFAAAADIISPIVMFLTGEVSLWMGRVGALAACGGFIFMARNGGFGSASSKFAAFALGCILLGSVLAMTGGFGLTSAVIL